MDPIAPEIVIAEVAVATILPAFEIDPATVPASTRAATTLDVTIAPPGLPPSTTRFSPLPIAQLDDEVVPALIVYWPELQYVMGTASACPDPRAIAAAAMARTEVLRADDRLPRDAAFSCVTTKQPRASSQMMRWTLFMCPDRDSNVRCRIDGGVVPRTSARRMRTCRETSRVGSGVRDPTAALHARRGEVV